jgi:phage baseplate assembly protein W
MTRGAGRFPFGVGYAGYTGFSDKPESGLPANGVAFINASGDYELGENGDVVKTSPLKQRIMLLLRTALGSVVGQQNIGLQVQRAVDNSWRYRMSRAVEKALAPVVLDGSIDIVRVVLQQTTSLRASITVVYTALETGEEREVTI